MDQELHPKALPGHTPGNLRARDICELSTTVSRFLRVLKRESIFPARLSFVYTWKRRRVSNMDLARLIRQ